MEGLMFLSIVDLYIYIVVWICHEKFLSSVIILRLLSEVRCLNVDRRTLFV